ncbi:lysostaphin resistance A-like protein [Pseudooceanicola sp.]|uniref:CPBP family intramembrane glutamic endopeptidase n=1 Tax=Pseudooceanicola sp. TaxID=1914328 RepID=UPI0035121F25
MPGRNHAYAAHESLVAPSRRLPQLWRLVAGLVLVAVILFTVSTTLTSVARMLAPELFRSGLRGPGAIGTTPASLLVLLYGFAILTGATLLAARLLQDRAPLSLIGDPRLALRQFWRVLRVLVLLAVLVLMLPPYDMGLELERNLDMRTWLALLPLSLGAVLVQTSSEELLFRGYIQQSLAARFSSPLIWMGVPALLFGLGHYTPAVAGANAPLILIWAVLFGLLTADLTARAGTLGPAIALHFVNNLSPLLLIAVPGSMSGLSLAVAPYAMSDTEEMRIWLVIDFALMLVSWLAARLAIRR